jgi:hypothetical protein
MAGGTAAGVEDREAVGRIGRIGRKRIRGYDCRDREPPEDSKTDRGEHNGSKHDTSQHSPIRHWAPSMVGQYGLTFGHTLAGNFGHSSPFRE